MMEVVTNVWRNERKSWGENITLQMKKCCSKRLSLFSPFCREYGTLFFLIMGQETVDFEKKTIKPKFKTFVRFNKKIKQIIA